MAKRQRNLKDLAPSDSFVGHHLVNYSWLNFTSTQLRNPIHFTIHPDSLNNSSWFTSTFNDDIQMANDNWLSWSSCRTPLNSITADLTLCWVLLNPIHFTIDPTNNIQRWYSNDKWQLIKLIELPNPTELNGGSLRCVSFKRKRLEWSYSFSGTSVLWNMKYRKRGVVWRCGNQSISEFETICVAFLKM